MDLTLACSPASSIAARAREEEGLAGCVEAGRRRSSSPDVGTWEAALLDVGRPPKVGVGRGAAPPGPVMLACRQSR
jgi:hypothetical protein